MVMRRFFLFLIPGICLFACHPGMELPSVPVRETAWTVLVYMNGDSDLESQALEDLKEMERAEILEGLEILVLADRTPGYDSGEGDWTGTRLYRVIRDPSGGYPLVSRRLSCPELGLTDRGDEEELNLGSPGVLAGFLRYGKSAFPGNRTMLILWGHGSGWRSLPVEGSGSAGILPELPAYRAFSFDDSDGDFLHTAELGQVLREEPVDLVGFDVCSAALLEVAWEIREGARRMAGSEDLVSVRGWNYSTLLAALSRSDGTEESAARALTDSFSGEYREASGAVFSVIDLTLLEPVMAGLDRFVLAREEEARISGDPGEYYRNLKNRLFLEVEDFYTVPGDLNLDLGDMARLIEGEDSPLAEAVDHAVTEFFSSGIGNPRASGLRIHLVPLGDTGRILPHNDAYFRNRPVSYPLDFVSRCSWCPDEEEEKGLLYRLFYDPFL